MLKCARPIFRDLFNFAEKLVHSSASERTGEDNGNVFKEMKLKLDTLAKPFAKMFVLFFS